ncbi:MAG: hypothetical protein HUU37_03255, partial [Bdellovibrionales bacterium]|nr:hypothetical protein [Bdellovibrionales bacterium]
MRRNQRGQGGLMFVLIAGSLLAVIVFFGWYKQRIMADVADRVENTLIAQEVTSAVAQRVQKIYAEESGCDPDTLDDRLSNLDELGALPAGVSYAVAASKATSGSNERIGLCTGGKGCRQIAVDIENRRYIATAGRVSGTSAITPNCPRDATVKIRVTIENTVYFRRVTLVNTCSYKSCSGGSFDSVTSDVTGNTVTTTACVPLASRRFGALVRATDTTIDLDDLRFARRYLSTGAGNSGDTTFLFGGSG